MPLTIPADPNRPYLRLPSLALGLVMAGSVTVAAVWWLLRPASTLGSVLPGCAQALILSGAALFYIRGVYAKRTRLVIDADGLELRQPFAAWHITWEQLADLFVTTPWDLTHKGGIAAGVRLCLVGGGTRHIPDVLHVSRHDLARLINMRGRVDPQTVAAYAGLRKTARSVLPDSCRTTQ